MATLAGEQKTWVARGAAWVRRQFAPTPEAQISRMAAVYTPVVRGFLMGGGIYYVFISLSHPFFETGQDLAILDGLAILSAITALLLWRQFRRSPPTLRSLELAALAAQVLFLANVTAYLLIHFEPMKLIYYVLLALVFGISAPTHRTACSGVVASVAALVIMAQRADGDLIGQYAFLGIAGAFSAIGMATVMRGAVTREIQARMRSEALVVAAEAANRAKSAFLATISHEIRTPLNGVLGMAQVMERDDLSEPQRDRLEIVQQSARGLMGIINDVLDFSKIEAGKMEVQPAPFSLAAFADGIDRFYGVLVRDKNVSFELLLNNSAGDLRMGDEARLRQIAHNLLSNALKFTPAGQITVKIEADAVQIRYALQDTGPGVPKSQQQQIFDKFTQVDDSNTRGAGGTGLGLAICRELATLMGGEVSLTSTEGAGSRFQLTLPMPVVAPPQIDAVSEPVLNHSADLSRGQMITARKPRPRTGQAPNMVPTT